MTDPEGLNAVRGIAWGCLLSLPLWALIGALAAGVWWVTR